MTKNIHSLQQQIEPIICLTAYTAPMAAACSPHCDLLLVGDSVSMVLHGMDNTQGATMDMMILHGQAVMRAQPECVVIVDMPFGSYETCPLQALENAQRIMDETACDGIKLEGGTHLADTIAYLVNNDIPVLGHVGLLPQTAENYKVRGRDENSAQQIMDDAIAVEKAGAFAVVIEAVTDSLAVDITQSLSIPTIGIGASAACGGQILVTDDMLGMTNGHIPKFVKQYATLAPEIDHAIMQYAQEVKSRTFPADIHTYKGTNQHKSKPAQIDDLKKAS